MLLKPLLAGMAVKVAAGFDDMFSRLPVVVSLTRTRLGKLAFSLGNLLAVLLVILLAEVLAPLLGGVAHFRLFVGGAILIIAAAVYFQAFGGRGARGQEKVLGRLKARFSLERFLTLVGAGFLVSLFTLIDDAVVYMPLFVRDGLASFAAAVGILVVTLLEIIIVIRAAERLQRLKHQREIASAALVVYAVLVLAGVI